MENSFWANKALNDTLTRVQKERFQFLTPEHLLAYGFLVQSPFLNALAATQADFHELVNDLNVYIEQLEHVDANVKYDIELSVQMIDVIQNARASAVGAEVEQIDITHFLKAIFSLNDSWAAYLLKKYINCDEADFLNEVDFAYDLADDANNDDASADNSADRSDNNAEPWRNLIVCMNDVVASHNPLIGRADELERTIQVLCRKEKNNPLHVGEPGVGKTALVYGLVQRIVDGDVPDRLKGARVYLLDLGNLLAGTQFRGDFEKRIKTIMDGVKKEGNAIVYIDEIHNLIGAGRTGDGSMDASNMLKPYLEGGDIRFIGSTTYQEYNRYFSKSKGIVRRFQQIDLLEPTTDEAVKIIEGLLPKYQEFHRVSYADGVVRHAVEMSAKYINERFLPDKAIDLIDEAGAFLELHPAPDAGEQVVTTELIDAILAKICKVKAFAEHKDDAEVLLNLHDRIASQIYGQPLAVKQVVESVQMGKAGLLDDGKPIASLLFVGPTGVGKTEITRVLAQELGLELVRFDMSEYAEKHTVAKLIGSPAGYVGYEDGGLLTDAIRKTPHCVLLLDEIEKAHSDIYNILLQIMDYAHLTDNKGQKADFRNVILIMTSNAGAQYASQASVGFASKVTSGQAMLAQVKKTFKPEFLNRLSGTVVFNDMDLTMARLILDKKLGQLKKRLKAKNVELELSDAAYDLILHKGFIPEYGAREMDRVLRQLLNPILTREILFGALKSGGTARIGCSGEELSIEQ